MLPHQRFLSCLEIVPLLSLVIAQVYLHSPSGRVERQRGEGDRADPPLA